MKLYLNLFFLLSISFENVHFHSASRRCLPLKISSLTQKRLQCQSKKTAFVRPRQKLQALVVPGSKADQRMYHRDGPWGKLQQRVVPSRRRRHRQQKLGLLWRRYGLWLSPSSHQRFLRTRYQSPQVIILSSSLGSNMRKINPLITQALVKVDELTGV